MTGSESTHIASQARRAFIAALAIATGLCVTWAIISVERASAGHNGAVVESQTGACGATEFTASIADPDGTHKVGNMYLVIDVDGDAQSANVPTDGSSASLSAGPFCTADGGTQTISWRVFGGAERSYDQPLWNGYGAPSFNSDVAAYADSVGGYSWVIAGTGDPNPFTTWNAIEVDTCVLTKEQCKQVGYADHGFRNQGQCIRFVNTGKDSRG